MSLFEPVSAPPEQPKANARAAIPTLIEGFVPLPPGLSLRSKGALETAGGLVRGSVGAGCGPTRPNVVLGRSS
jgi:hypothetical protein